MTQNSQQILQILISGLNSDDPALEQFAWDQLRRISETSVIQAAQISSRFVQDTNKLINALDDDSENLRISVALALGQKGNNEGFPILKDVFKGSDLDVRRVITSIFGASGKQAEAEFLLSVFDDVSPQVRIEITRAIAGIFSNNRLNKTASELVYSRLLIAALEDDEEGVRGASITELVELLTPNQVGILVLDALEKRRRVIDDAKSVQAVTRLALHETSLSQPVRNDIMLRLEQLLTHQEYGVVNQTVNALASTKRTIGTIRFILNYLEQPGGLTPAQRTNLLRSLPELSPRLLYDEETLKRLNRFRRDADPQVREAATKVMGSHRPPGILLKVAGKTASIGAAGFTAVGVGIYAVLFFLYTPSDSLPDEDYWTEVQGIYGSIDQQAVISENFPWLALETPQTLEQLRPVPGEAYKMGCPTNQILDKILLKSNCEAMVFGAMTAEGVHLLRFLVMRDNEGEDRIIGIGEPRSGMDGVFVELTDLNGQDTNMLTTIRSQGASLVNEIGSSSWEKVSSREKAIFMPAVFNERLNEETERLRTTNPVINHLFTRVQDVNPEARLGARIYSIRESGASGLYNSRYNIVQLPMMYQGDYADTLSHELVHAIMDEQENAGGIMLVISQYLRLSHPNMFNTLIPERYGHLDSGIAGDLGRAEEAVAFMIGSIASESPVVSFFTRPPIVTEVDQIRVDNEALEASDIELLVLIELLPEWMDPSSLNYQEDAINEEYYEVAKRNFNEIVN